MSQQVDPAAFPDFYRQLAAALEWPDRFPDLRLDQRAEKWAAILANATWHATHAGYCFEWDGPTDSDGEEARKVLRSAAVFDQIVNELAKHHGLGAAERLTVYDTRVHSRLVLLLERVLHGPKLLRDRFAGAMLREADKLRPAMPGGAGSDPNPVTPSPQSGLQGSAETSPAAARHPDRPSADRMRDIITAIQKAGTPCTAPEVQQHARQKTPGKLPANLSWMANNGHLVHIPGRGYWLPDQPPPP